MEDGLPSNTIYSVFCDSKGFLWVSTDKGVARYNGLRFETFTTFNGLADNEVFFVEEDLQKRLWFGTFNGKFCYFKNDTFHNPNNTPFLKQKSKRPHIFRIFPEKDGSVSVCFIDADYFCNISADTCVEIHFKEDAPYMMARNIYYIEKQSATRYKFVTSIKSFTIDLNSTQREINVKPNPVKDEISVSNHGPNQPWIIFYDSAYYSADFRDSGKYPPGLRMPKIRPKSLLRDEHNNLFYATDHGIFLNDNIRILETENTTAIVQDVHKNYWVSTLGNGLYCFSKNFNSSTIYNKSYSGRIQYSREVKNKLLFYSDDHKLYTIEDGRGKYLFRTPSPPIDSYWSATATFFVDTDLTCYNICGHHSFVVKDILTKFPRVRTIPYRMEHDRHSFKKIIKCENRLYVNIGFGLRSIDLNDYTKNDSVKYHSFPVTGGERIFAIAKSDDNSVWYSTVDSLHKTQNNVSVKQTQYPNVAFKNFDFYGKFMVGITHDNQLLIYETNNGKIKKHTIEGERIWENLYRVDNEHILISTNGLYHLLRLNYTSATSPYTLTAIENSFLPLQVDEICIGEFDCYFFKDGNITVFKKSELLEKPAPPLLQFACLKTSKMSYRINGDIRLTHDESRNISISFSSLSYDAKELIMQYSISKKNGSDNWVNIQGDINLAHHPYGTYIVKIRGRTLSSEFGTPAVFKITILRPFWATWWFITATCCVTGLLIWLIVKGRIRATVLKKEKEHENHVRFIKSEYKAMNALMNPHFIFNSINNVQSLVNNREVLNATEYLGIFADLIRQNMHNISNDIIPLQKELDLVENYLLLEKLRFEDQLNYSINIADNMFLTDIMVPPLLLQPLVENSIKHGILPLRSQGRDGHVAINVYEDEDKLFIEVVDNGIGITKAKQKKSLHESYGLNNIKNRVQQLSIILGKEMSFELTEVFDKEGNPEGTKAIISMPIG